MATILTPDYSNFIGSPITVPVQAGSPAGATFHRVRLVVTINSSGTPFEFSTPVSSGGETVRFDISSAFRAFAESHEYTPITLNVYPNMSASITAYDDYMVDGEEHRGTGESTTTISPLYCGHLTDMERLLGLRYPASGRYSRKPTSSPELAFIDYESLQPGLCVSETTPVAPAVTAVTVPAGSASRSNIFGIPAPHDGYELRFINSLGVHENVFLTSLPTTEATIQTDRYVIARQETLDTFSRGTTRKHSNHHRYHLTAGPLDQEWQQWYIDEVLMARWAWIKPVAAANSSLFTLHSSLPYIPCHVLPEDTIQALDRQKGGVLTVPITVELDIEGSSALT
jgi:hypothetical protein